MMFEIECDMEAALRQYSLIKTTKTQGRPQDKRQAYKSGSYNVDMNAVLKNYLPTDKDLQQKTESFAENPQFGSNCKGLNKYFLCQELKRRRVDAKIDLHQFHQKEAAQLLRTFLYESQAKGFCKIGIVHGKGLHSLKGKGVLRELVWSFLREAQAAGEVLDFNHPPEIEGGKGMTVVLLWSAANRKSNLLVKEI